jgi:hypothetical protein
MIDKPLPAELLQLLSGGKVKPEEGLRLIRAFIRIADPAARLALIQIAEKLATEPAV